MQKRSSNSTTLYQFFILSNSKFMFRTFSCSGLAKIVTYFNHPIFNSPFYYVRKLQEILEIEYREWDST